VSSSLISCPNNEIPEPASNIICLSDNLNSTQDVARPRLADVSEPAGNPPLVPQKIRLSCVGFTFTPLSNGKSVMARINVAYNRGELNRMIRTINNLNFLSKSMNKD